MKIMWCPQHVGHSIAHNADRAAATKSLSIGFSEIDKGKTDDVSILRREMPDYIIHGEDKGGHSREVPIAFRKTALYFSERSRTVRLSSDLGPGISNDRWMEVLEFRNRVRRSRGYFHINTHWNAAIQDRSTGRVNSSARADAMEGAGLIIQTQLHRFIEESRQGFVTGDFNYRSEHDASEAWHWSPENIFDRCGMKWRNVGLDWIAWTPGMQLKTPLMVIPPGKSGNLSDHPWLLANFSRRRAA